jgi:hypothetical protein
VKALALLVLPLAACSSVSISTDFGGGNLGKVEQVSETHFRCAVPGQADHEGRNRQASWYYFRLDGAKGREVTITLTDLRGEYNYKPGNLCLRDDTPPVVSADGKTWRHLEKISVEKDEATFRVTPDSNSFWIAHIEPYTYSRLAGYILGGGFHFGVLGESVEGRSIFYIPITDGSLPDEGKKVLWLMCRQHAWETGTSFVGQGAIEFMLSEEARELRKRVIFKVLPMVDPDGCERGGVRFNRNGYDVNRNWDTVDPENREHRKLMPEIAATKHAIQASGPFDLFLTLHNQETDEWLSGSEKHKALADRFFARLIDKTTFNPGAKEPRKPAEKFAPGRASVYEYFDLDRGLPAFILEQGITLSSKLGRLPTSQDRIEFGRQLAKAMCDVVLEK